jgi:cytoskeleton protein RodZ
MSDGVQMPMPQDSDQRSAGSLLKAAREAQGLHVAALAVSLKVPVKKLEALEADRLDQLPDAVFVRALASSVCRALKVDPSEVLARLPQNQPRLNVTESSSQTPFRTASDRAAPNILTALSRPAMLAVLALLLGALVLIFMPDFASKNAGMLATDTSGEAGTAQDAAANGTAMGAGAVLSSTDGLGAGDAAGAQTTVAVTADSLASSTVSVAVSTPTVASPTLVISSNLASTGTTADNADGIVAFSAQGETWVEVVDGRGKTTLRRTLLAGESVGAGGALPLKVTVGRADQTQVTLRGQALDTTGKVRDNVLRFEVR